MNDRIRELNEQLELEKKKEKIEEVLKRYNSLRKEIGKCYSSHTFDKAFRSSFVEAGIYEVVDIGFFKNSYDLKEESRLSESDLYDLTKDEIEKVVLAIKIDSCRYMKSAGSRNAIQVICSLSYENAEYYSRRGFKYKLSKEEFKIIKNSLMMKAEEFGHKLRESLPEYDVSFRDDYVFDKINWLKKNGYIVGTLPSEHSVYLLNQSPFVYGKYILINDESRRFIQERIDYERRCIIDYDCSMRRIKIYNEVLSLWNKKA